MNDFQQGIANIVAYLTTLFLSLGGGTVTGPMTFNGITNNGNEVIQGSLTVAGNSNFAGVIYDQNGTAGAPAYSFASDHNAGVYYTAGLVHVSIAGIDSMSVGNSSVGVNMPFGFNAPANNLMRTMAATITGAANNCTYAVDTNNNLGFYKAATNSIGVAVNGVAAGTWDPNGIHVVQAVQVQSGGSFRSGSGSPNGAVAGNIGDLYLSTAGGASTTLYVKESGAGTTTGWIAK